MPLNRTPPTDSPTVFASPLQHYASEPNITDSPLIDAETNVASSLFNSTTRITRRRKRSETDDFSKREILHLFSSLKEDQDAKFSAILNSVQDVKTAINVMSQKYEETLERLNVLEVEKKASDTKIAFLEHKVEFLERQSRGTSIELRNIPQETNETKEDLRNLLKKTSESLDVLLYNSDVKDVYRINTKSGNKPLIADFTTVFKRDEFLSAVKKYNKEHETTKFNTGSLGISGPNKPVYISENLIQKDRRLFFLAREFVRNSEYAFCWTSFGRIFIRKSEGTPPVRITCENDIDSLKIN